MIPEKIKNLVKSHPTLQAVALSYLSVYSFINSLVNPPIYLRIRFIRKKIFNLMDRKTDEQRLMINIGGGHYYRRHWKILDLPSQWYRFVKGEIDYEFDLTSGDAFPFSDNSVSFFYSSHTLEHIPQECCQHVLNEIFRCLKIGGAVRLTMPDFDLAYTAFAKNDRNFFVKYLGRCIEEKFLAFFAGYLKDRVSPEELRKDFASMRKEEFADYYTRQIPRYHQKLSAGNHINWWNYRKLSGMLKQAGFNKIYRSTAQGSRFTEMRGVGWNYGFDSTHPEVSFFVEAVKQNDLGES